MSTLLVDLGAGPVTGAVPVVVLPAWNPAQNPEPPPGQGPEFGKASPVALVVIVLLGLATVLLIRGMSKRIRRLPPSFDDPTQSPTPADPASEGPAAAEAPDEPEPSRNGDRER